MKTRRDPLLPALLIALLACNAGLFVSEPARLLAFRWDRVLAGEWWRLLSHPFVHVSGYHLLLDAGSLAVLLVCLRHLSLFRRLSLLAACAAGSLLAAMVSDAQAMAAGFCGLSGVAHGVLAYAALDSAALAARDRLLRFAGLAAAGSVVCKGAWEAASGTVLLAGLHLGAVGIPVPACHAGGMVAGLLAFLLRAAKPASTKRPRAVETCFPLPVRALSNGMRAVSATQQKRCGTGR